MTQNSSLKIKTLQIQGMDCGSCAKTIEVALRQLYGITEATVNFATSKARVSYNPEVLNEKSIHDRIKDLGYTVEQNHDVQSHQHIHSCNGEHHHDHQSHNHNVHLSNNIEVRSYNNDDNHEYSQPINKSKQKEISDLTGWRFWIENRRGQSLVLAGIGLVLGLLTQYLLPSIWIARAFYSIGIVIAGYPIARAGLFELRLRRADMNLLMTISVIGAVILGDWFEAALVLFLFSLGTTLQVFTFSRTRNAIRSLMDLTPPTATIKRGNQEFTVAVESIQIGETLTIRPGQRVALDGVVISGISTIDQSSITGESIPEDKTVGDKVFAGTLNHTGFLEIKVTHTHGDTTVAKIINLVEQAQESRAPSQQWVDKFAEVYTPIVVLVAIAIALIPPLVFAQPFHVWFYRALVMLVIACPCALVISTPVSIVSAIGAATHQGILFKGGNALETAGRLKTLAFDKTGTLTKGEPVVLRVYNFGNVSEKTVLQIAASLEQHSEHPLAKAIVVKALELGLDLETPIDFTALPGKGIQANFSQQSAVHLYLAGEGEQLYLVGNRRLFKDKGILLSIQAESSLAEIEQMGQIPVLVGTNKELLGAITLSDYVRLEARESILKLQQVGLKRLVMLTGDIPPVAKQIAQQVGITEYQAGLLPEDKLLAIKQMGRAGVVGMVGDGINDAPALAAADISFAIGEVDIALETADVVLMGSDLRRLPYAIILSRRTLSVIQQNVIFSLVTKALFLLLGTFGIVGLTIAVLADTGTSLLVTANGMRLFKTKTF